MIDLLSPKAERLEIDFEIWINWVWNHLYLIESKILARIQEAPK